MRGGAKSDRVMDLDEAEARGSGKKRWQMHMWVHV